MRTFFNVFVLFRKMNYPFGKLKMYQFPIYFYVMLVFPNVSY